MGDYGRLVPVFLAGGSGTRLWPVSTPETPKQFLKLCGDTSLLALSLSRVPPSDGFADPVIVGNRNHESLIRQALGDRPASLILEASARNTAAAIALAALEAGPSDHLLVMPSDHLIGDLPAFRATVERQRRFLGDGLIVTFGVSPTRPETGYGYIRPHGPAGTARPIAAFHEKPDGDTARRLIAEGWLWNSGIFLFEAQTVIHQMEKLAPGILAAARMALRQGERRGATLLPAGEPLDDVHPLSFDRAVMERGAPAVVAEYAGGWSDMGSWEEVWRFAEKDADGTACDGRVMLDGVRNALVRSDGPLTLVSGLDDVVVINQGGVVLVTTRARSQDVGRILAAAAATDLRPI